MCKIQTNEMKLPSCFVGPFLHRINRPDFRKLSCELFSVCESFSLMDGQSRTDRHTMIKDGHACVITFSCGSLWCQQSESKWNEIRTERRAKRVPAGQNDDVKKRLIPPERRQPPFLHSFISEGREKCGAQGRVRLSTHLWGAVQ